MHRSAARLASSGFIPGAMLALALLAIFLRDAATAASAGDGCRSHGAQRMRSCRPQSVPRADISLPLSAECRGWPPSSLLRQPPSALSSAQLLSRSQGFSAAPRRQSGRAEAGPLAGSCAGAGAIDGVLLALFLVQFAELALVSWLRLGFLGSVQFVSDLISAASLLLDIRLVAGCWTARLSALAARPVAADTVQIPLCSARPAAAVARMSCVDPRAQSVSALAHPRAAAAGAVPTATTLRLALA